MRLNGTLEEARTYAASGRLAQWVQAFLRDDAGRYANPNLALADGLLLEERFYLGPVRIPLALLTTVRVEEDIADKEERERYDRIVDRIVAALPDWDMPPFIAEYRDGRLFLTDGNHRFSALRRLGIGEFEAVIWGAAARASEAETRFGPATVR